MHTKTLSLVCATIVCSCAGTPTQTELARAQKELEQIRADSEATPTEEFVIDTARIPARDPGESASFKNAYAISPSPVVVKDLMGLTAYAWTSLDINIKDSSSAGNNHCYMYADVWLTTQNDPRSPRGSFVAVVAAQLDTEKTWFEGIAQAQAPFEIQSVNGCPLSQCALGRFYNGRDADGNKQYLYSDPVCLDTPLDDDPF
jgi:hypothetical protein